MPNQYTSVARPIIYVIGPSIAYVQLPRDKFCLIDCEDGPHIGMHSWSFYTNSSDFHYPQRVTHAGGTTKHFALHRALIGDSADSLICDHVNGNTLDNRRCNLRYATHSQNAYNAKLSRRNSTGFKGVHKQDNFWRARIYANGRLLNLGSFKSPEEAHKAYCTAAEKFAQEFARFE